MRALTSRKMCSGIGVQRGRAGGCAAPSSHWSALRLTPDSSLCSYLIVMFFVMFAFLRFDSFVFCVTIPLKPDILYL